MLIPLAAASIGLVVWINEIPDWEKGEALAQMQFEYWYLQPLYPDEEIGLSRELVPNRKAEVRRTRPSCAARRNNIDGSRSACARMRSDRRVPLLVLWRGGAVYLARLYSAPSFSQPDTTGFSPCRQP